MTLPALPDWKATSPLLHQVVSLIGPIHKALLPHRDNYLHLPMSVQPEGLVSQTLPGGGKIHLNLKNGGIRYLRSDGGEVGFSIADHTQRSLFESLLSALADDGLGPGLGLDQTDSPVAGLVSKLVSEGTAGASVSLETLTADDPLAGVQDSAAAYAEIQYSMFTTLARVRARLLGAMTPVIVWPEHLDLSTLWFPASNPGMDDHGSHVSMGFAPFTPGQYEYPYFYAYAYPYPEAFEPPTLPSPAFWHEEGWRGVVVKYEEMAVQPNPEAFLEGLSLEVFEVLRRVLEN